ncbi:MAG: peptide-methionine (S)-S-oxide reductase MsrA [Candidatus Puniceispirillales bacterium]
MICKWSLAMLSSLFAKPMNIPDAKDALPGRHTAIMTPQPHAVHGRPIVSPFPDGMETILVGMGCFWGAERLFWTMGGVWTTSVGYAGGTTPNPTYEEVCSGLTGHTEIVEVVYDPAVITLDDILRCFWQEHNPTQGMRQGNDRGTQYRSAIYWTTDEQMEIVKASKAHYASQLLKKGLPGITTEIEARDIYYLAEDYHQQYLHKNPNGYCGLAGCGVSY